LREPKGDASLFEIAVSGLLHQGQEIGDLSC
jgi:hypothetical protein